AALARRRAMARVRRAADRHHDDDAGRHGRAGVLGPAPLRPLGSPNPARASFTQLLTELSPVSPNGGYMSKRNWFIVTTAPRLAALTGVCLILAAGCEKKKADGESGSKPTSGAADKAGRDSAMPGITATHIKVGH